MPFRQQSTLAYLSNLKQIPFASTYILEYHKHVQTPPRQTHLPTVRPFHFTYPNHSPFFTTLSCGHAVNDPETTAVCEATNCIFSVNHPANCPDCKKTCWQYHQYPEQYTVHPNDFCPACRQQQ
ncbi:unnamed protein product [Somion occarium]|uniref:RING-type domain-containing protein n=1 Tax=Somion occarium TaxID=3059160 RepID=A0ABP1CZU6_9APHY